MLFSVLKSIGVILFFLTGPLLSFGQNRPTADPIADSADNHIRIPGTRLSIISPRQFYLTHTFTGLLKTDGSAVIQVYDLRESNYYKDSKSFSKEQFEAKGEKVLAFKQFKVAGFPARFCYMKGDSSKSILALIFGDSTFSTTLIGLYPDTAMATGQQIRDVYASISYDKYQRVNPFETAPFLLDTTASPFRFALFNEPLFVYSLDGKDPGEGHPFLTVTPYPRQDGVSLQEISQNLIVKDMQHGLTNPFLKNISLDSVGGYEAYEVEIYCELGGQKGVLYQFIATGKNKTIVIEGIANSDFDNYVRQFRALAHTVKIM